MPLLLGAVGICKKKERKQIILLNVNFFPEAQKFKFYKKFKVGQYANAVQPNWVHSASSASPMPQCLVFLEHYSNLSEETDKQYGSIACL